MTENKKAKEAKPTPPIGITNNPPTKVKDGGSEPLTQLDRINYSAGRKMRDGNYGSFEFHCSMSTDIMAGETVKEATKRAVEYVEKVLVFKCKQAEEGKLGY
jgi:hypothetical protein